jgi:hypothetical protein
VHLSSKFNKELFFISQKLILLRLCLAEMSQLLAEKKRPSVGVTLGATLLLQRAGENPLKGSKQLKNIISCSELPELIATNPN